MAEELRDFEFDEYDEYEEFEECEWPDDDPLICSPSDIFELLGKDIMGQDNAKRAVSILAWDLLQGRRSVNLVIGETGSGKTALFRSLEKQLSIHFEVIDASKITATGWKGASVGEALLSTDIDAQVPCILFFDEADSFFRPVINNEQTNFSALVQKDLLALCDTDNEYVTVMRDAPRPSQRIWLGNVTIVMAGAFQDLFDNKSAPKRTIGFAESAELEKPDRTVTLNDLIDYGMTKEMAGRINRIICMDEVDEEVMLQIAEHTVHCLEDDYECPINVDATLLAEIAASARTSGLGARYIRNELIRYIDELQFSSPHTEEIEISG